MISEGSVLMRFDVLGDISKPAVNLMHGMCQNSSSIYDKLKMLESCYYLIFPSMDGFYEGSGEFTSFEDQCKQIEDYVRVNHGGSVYGFYGISQGTIIGCELLARGNISIEKVFFDGTYVAHQGRIAGLGMARLFIKAKKNGNKLPKAFMLPMKLMGLSEDDMVMLNSIYFEASDNCIKRNMAENYTYRAKNSLAGTTARVTLCCGSREPYAKKSHRILKTLLPDCREIVIRGLGHGQLCMKSPGKLCTLIKREWDK